MNFLNKLKKSSSQGFTLIELLVVIAIIGILSGIVLTSLGTARNKGKDAAIKGTLSGIRAQAEIAQDNYANKYNNSGADVFSTSDCSTLTTASTILADVTIENELKGAKAQTGGAVICALPTATVTYMFAAKENAGIANGYWCVDSGGVSKEIDITTVGNIVAADDTCTEADAR